LYFLDRSFTCYLITSVAGRLTSGSASSRLCSNPSCPAATKYTSNETVSKGLRGVLSKRCRNQPTRRSSQSTRQSTTTYTTQRPDPCTGQSPSICTRIRHWQHSSYVFEGV